LGCGDAITVSVEPNLLALARGFIVKLTPREVVIGMDHGLDLNNIKNRLSPSKTGNGLPAAKPMQVIFRIDKDELLGGMGRLRDNIARLFYADGDVRRLQFVVDLKPPRFYEDNDELRPRPVDDVCGNLNQVQQRALAKILNARDYALILGMPGMGKTTDCGHHPNAGSDWARRCCYLIYALGSRYDLAEVGEQCQVRYPATWEPG
jgi:DNA replication ATP-dependent helicase Dna2